MQFNPYRIKASHVSFMDAVGFPGVQGTHTSINADKIQRVDFQLWYGGPWGLKVVIDGRSFIVSDSRIKVVVPCLPEPEAQAS